MAFYTLPTSATNLDDFSGAVSAVPLKISDELLGSKENPYAGWHVTYNYVDGKNQYTFKFKNSGGDYSENIYRSKGTSNFYYIPWKYVECESKPADTTTTKLSNINGRRRLKNIISENPPTAVNQSYININISVEINGSVIDCWGMGVWNNRFFVLPRGLEYSEDNYILIISYTDIASPAVFEFENKDIPTAWVNYIDSVTDYIYPYTFTIKSQDGSSELTSLQEAPAMVDATVSVVGNVKTLIMTGANEQAYTMTWQSETPEGKQFLGLSYGANATRASIPTGRTTPVTWDGSVTVYEVYGTYRPPVTTFDINLYQNSAEVNRVDKSDYLTSVGTLSGVLREECSIITPSITFKQTTVPTFNYVYIAAFGRYYYVTGIASVSNDVWRMSLSCDVLMTWKDDIKALTAIIARQENSFNPLLLDSELPAQANQNITVTEFPAGGFDTENAIEYPFILTVVGA